MKNKSQIQNHIKKLCSIGLLCGILLSTVACGSEPPVSEKLIEAGPVYLAAKASADHVLPVADKDNSTVLPVSGTKYYVSASGGNDNNDGLSPEAPWKTLRKVSGFTFKPGDGVFLKCGDIWEKDSLGIECSGTLEKPIYLSSYGMGTRPWIRKSLKAFNDIYPPDQGKMLSVGIRMVSASGWYISGLILSDLQMGVSVVNTKNKPMHGLTIENCDFYDITSQVKKYKPVTFGDNWGGFPSYATAVGIWGSNPYPNSTHPEGMVHLSSENSLTHLTIAGVNISDCDAALTLQGISDAFLLKDTVVENTHSAGVMLSTFHFEEGKEGIIENVKIMGVGVQRGFWWGTAALQFNDCRNMIARNCEMAYTGIGGYVITDMIGIDFEGLCQNILVDDCYIHDNGGPAYLVYCNPDWGQGISQKNLRITNNRMENNGLADSENVAFMSHCWNENIGGLMSGNKILLRDSRQMLNTILYNSLVKVQGLTNEYPPNWKLENNEASGVYEKPAFTLAENEVARWDFDNAYDATSWTDYENMTALTINGRHLTSTVLRENASLVSPRDLKIEPMTIKSFKVTFKNKTGAETFKVEIRKTKEDKWSDAQSFEFPVSANDKDFKSYEIDTSRLAFMRDGIYQLRITPAVEGVRGYVQIDSISLLK